METLTDIIEENRRKYLETKNMLDVDEKCYWVLIDELLMKRPTGEDRLRILKIARAWFFKENNKVLMSHDEQERMIDIFSKKVAICEYFNSL